MTAETLPNDLDALKGMVLSREAVIADHEAHIARLEERLRLFQASIYGPKSEKQPPDAAQFKLPIFDEAERLDEVEGVRKTEEVLVPAHARKKPGRRPLPMHLPRVDVVHDLPEEHKTCACGCALTRMGEEVSEKLDIVPAKMQVIRHIRYKYACRGCEGVEAEGGAVKIAALPPQIIPQGIVTPGLLAQVLVAKYADALPLYRQEAQFARLGIDLSRTTMAGWVMRAAEACAPLLELMEAEIRSGPLINMDETSVQVLKEPGRANTTKSYMWVARGGDPARPVVLFQYHPSRAGAVAGEILGDYQGYLQTDGYSGYAALGERADIVHLGCMAHVRRKFMEVLKAGPKDKKASGGTAPEVLDLIAGLYAVEKKAREAGLAPEQIKELRTADSRPILEAMKALLDQRGPTAPPQSLLGKAIAYAQGQWPRLLVYLENGMLRPDNNLAENAIRPFAVGRKNWLFSGSPKGAAASAAIYSLIETAKANGLEPYAYLRHIFEYLPPASSPADLKALLPQYAQTVLLKPVRS